MMGRISGLHFDYMCKVVTQPRCDIPPSSSVQISPEGLNVSPVIPIAPAAPPPTCVKVLNPSPGLQFPLVAADREQGWLGGGRGGVDIRTWVLLETRPQTVCCTSHLSWATAREADITSTPPPHTHTLSLFL